MRGKKFIAGSVFVGVVAAASSGLMASSASASSLPRQKAAASDSVQRATVLDGGANPQFLHAIANDVVAGVTGAVGAKAVESAVKVTTKLKSVSSDSSSSSESSSSSSGGPVTSPASLHGMIPGDAQFDAS
ncbi:hypothetical protein [Streptomyces sp. NBC_00989]|uniref:hypothetical protein n=1 Tax=Streptomyces sp. NBC_00989 TaxID=2903705 RepID=UPI00386DACD7|nr:hypothetical protein OG714_26990 [Streptomyces sp. NBC_00989]